MKNFIFFFLVALLISFNSIFSQTKKGGWEFSLSGNFGSVSSSSEITGSSRSDESQGYILLSIRPGFYIDDGLAIEPEIFWTAIENNPPAFSINGNLAFNLSIPESHITPFVLVGYGTGNAIPFFQSVLFRFSDKWDISVLNIGTGIKYFFTERIALRTEYRYQRYSQESTYNFGSFSYTRKNIFNFHHVFFGFSVFFP